MVRNDWQRQGLAMAAALTCYKKLAKLATWDNLLGCGEIHQGLRRREIGTADRPDR
ncbi:hypothetical protein [Streptomyces sp. NPDC005046]